MSYKKPGWFTVNVFNRGVALATRAGLSVRGSRILEVRGRTSGRLYQTPVNLLRHEGRTYLVAPRGETQWVRNLRVAGGGTLLLGHAREPFTAVELTDAEKPNVLRAYLRRWRMESGVFFGGMRADSPDAEIQRIAPDHPAFVIESRP